MRYALVFLLALYCSACSTTFTQLSKGYEGNKSCPDDFTIPNVFSGTVFNAHCLTADNLGFLCFVDLPLSIVADTLIVPYTVYKQTRYGHWYSKELCLEQVEATRNQSLQPKSGASVE